MIYMILWLDQMIEVVKNDIYDIWRKTETIWLEKYQHFLMYSKKKAK